MSNPTIPAEADYPLIYPFKTQPFKHQLEEWGASRSSNARAIFWEQGCVDASTEYLSPSGWRRMDEWDGGRVAQWNPETRAAEFVQPSEYVKLPCSEMIQLKNQRGVDQVLSPEHRVPFIDRDSGKVRICEARDLLQLAPKAWRYLPATFTLSSGAGIGLGEAELRVQIAVIADGHFPRNVSTRRTYLNLRKQRKQERLEQLLQAAGIAYRCRVGVEGWKHYAFEAPRREKSFGGDWWNASHSDRLTIADEVGHWDGTITPRAVDFYTRDEASADFIQFVFSSLGRICYKGVCGKDYTVHSRARGENFTLCGYSVSSVQSPDGFKYCFRVPSSFLVFRRNGNVFPSGNTGKSKLTIDTAGWLWLQGKIDAVVVVAPNGVHRNWVENEIPDHLPDSIMAQSRAFHYQSPKSGAKWHKQAVRAITHHKGLIWFTISYEGFMTAAGKRALIDIFNSRRVLYVLDEAHYIKSADSQRTRSILKSAVFAPYRRVLTGTPIAQGPFDIYTQLQFLQDDFWAPHGLSTFPEFKQHFGVWGKGWNPSAWSPITKKRTGAEYDVLKSYRRLDELNQLIQPISSRVTKDDVLDLPPKMFSKQYFDMTPEQAKLYRQMRDEFIVWLETGGLEKEAEAAGAAGAAACATCGGAREVVAEGFIYPCPDCAGDGAAEALEGNTPVIAALAITRLLRLQQITCGYLPTDDEDEPLYMIPGANRRLMALCDNIENRQHKTIVWARFRLDIDLIMGELQRRGIKAVRYDGQVNDDARAEGKALFQGERPVFERGQMVGREAIPEQDQAQVFVGNPAAGATGLTLTAARFVDYYSNSFKLIDRLQSEDRAHRIGQANQVLYTDYIAQETIDEKIVKSLREKFNIASQITGDRMKEWL